MWYSQNQTDRVLSALTSRHISNSHRNPVSYQTGPRKNETGHFSVTFFHLKTQTNKQTNKNYHHSESIHLPSLDTYKQENNLPSPCTMSEAWTLQSFILHGIAKTLPEKGIFHWATERRNTDFSQKVHGSFSLEKKCIVTDIKYKLPKCIAQLDTITIPTLS